MQLDRLAVQVADSLEQRERENPTSNRKRENSFFARPGLAPGHRNPIEIGRSFGAWSPTCVGKTTATVDRSTRPQTSNVGARELQVLTPTATAETIVDLFHHLSIALRSRSRSTRTSRRTTLTVRVLNNLIAPRRFSSESARLTVSTDTPR